MKVKVKKLKKIPAPIREQEYIRIKSEDDDSPLFTIIIH